MAREFMYIDGVTSGSSSGGADNNILVTPAFPDSIHRALIICVEVCDTAGLDNGLAYVAVGSGFATQVKYQTGSCDCSVWVFKDPPKAAFHVIASPIQTSTANIRMQVYEIEQLDPVLPIGQNASRSGTGTTDSLTLNPVDSGTSLCFQAIAVFAGTATTTVTSISPFGSDDTVIVGSSPFRMRAASASSGPPQGGANVTAQYNIAASKAFAHVAVEVRGEDLFPLCAAMGMGF